MVKDMLMASTSEPIEKMFLINSLYRLGVSYHFENEIEEHLNLLFDSLPEHIEDNDYDLYTIAVIFQVFRLHGYKMLCDVFSKFQDGDGKFKEALISDIKGMISLYEASHFRMNGELILDEALAFTTKHLESLANQSSPHLGEYIVNALFRPYHHGMQRLEARQYISFYEKDESRNDVLLKFGKYDFNRIQLLLEQELSVLSSWYKELNLKCKFPYARQRIVESALGIYFEPCYARGRNIIAKLAALAGILDDVYEAYGLYEELQSFTDAIQRFDISAMDELTANYQKILYETILDVHDEVENQEAIKTFREKLAVRWKDINEGCMRTTPVPQQILRRALNYARLLDFAYRDDDQYTKPELFKDGITKVLIHPIPL
ncbi:Terpene synthase [Theobroma cacao]|nr:Terpene synthase [Theobroma cacao]